MEKKSTILIVDDEKQVVELLVTHFRRRNYQPIATVNPKVVEQTLKTFEVHLILVDLRMEKRSGYDIIESLRKQNINIPVLVMTAYLQDEKKNLEKLGITENQVIQKPFGDFSKAEALINKVLNKVLIPGEVGSEYEDRIYRNNRTKVLIVEDEREIAEMLAEELESKKYEVKIFVNGKAGLDYFVQNKDNVHIAIIDLALPGLSGDILIQEMLKLKPDIQIMPVSGHYASEIQHKLELINFPPEKLIVKPLHLEDFLEQVKVMAANAGTL